MRLKPGEGREAIVKFLDHCWDLGDRESKNIVMNLLTDTVLLSM